MIALGVANAKSATDGRTMRRQRDENRQLQLGSGSLGQSRHVLCRDEEGAKIGVEVVLSAKRTLDMIHCLPKRRTAIRVDVGLSAKTADGMFRSGLTLQRGRGILSRSRSIHSLKRVV